MARVYQALKARIMAGEFAPGERIDPARLSIELSASATPIRDALHRLGGERLVESWQHEGFRQPLVSEAGLRDLYGWSEDLVFAVIRATAKVAPHVVESVETIGHDVIGDPPDIFLSLARLSPNYEHRLAMTSLNERSQSIRRVEARLFPGTQQESDLVSQLIQERHWSDLRRWNARYHSARLRRVPEIAAAFRRRET